MSKLKFFMIQTIFDIIYPTAMWLASVRASGGSVTDYNNSGFTRMFAPTITVYTILNAMYLINGKKRGVYSKSGFTLLGMLITMLGIAFIPVGVLLIVNILA